MIDSTITRPNKGSDYSTLLYSSAVAVSYELGVIRRPTRPTKNSRNALKAVIR